jgi:uncharacterized membrane protein
VTAVLRRFPIGVVGVAGIAVLALLPEPLKGRMTTHGPVHALTHFAAFAALQLLNSLTVKDHAAVRTAVLLLAFGILLEALQTRVYQNYFEYRDVLADATGIAMGLLLRALWQPEQ